MKEVTLEPLGTLPVDDRVDSGGVCTLHELRTTLLQQRHAHEEVKGELTLVICWEGGPGNPT